MDISLFFRGVSLGFSIAAPVGVIGVLCINRTLVQGSIVGLVSGLGAATADAIYGCIAGFGLTFISSFAVNQQFWLRSLGGIFLCYLGIKTFLAKPANKEVAMRSSSSLFSAYISTFFLTLTNPMTIIAFLAIFSGLGLANTNSNYISTAVLVLGVFIGSSLWWLLLSSGVSCLRTKFNLKKLRLFNYVSGIIITVFGLLALSHRSI